MSVVIVKIILGEVCFADEQLSGKRRAREEKRKKKLDFENSKSREKKQRLHLLLLHVVHVLMMSMVLRLHACHTIQRLSHTER